jgi:hypothetical protein
VHLQKSTHWCVMNLQQQALASLQGGMCMRQQQEQAI